MADQVREYLYIGDTACRQPDNIPSEVDFVINLMKQESGHEDVFYPLEDGHMDDLRLKGAVITALNRIERDETVLIHCAMGQSRSVGVGAATISLHENIPFEESMDFIRDKRPIANPEPSIRSTAKRIIDGEI